MKLKPILNEEKLLRFEDEETKIRYVRILLPTDNLINTFVNEATIVFNMLNDLKEESEHSNRENIDLLLDYTNAMVSQHLVEWEQYATNPVIWDGTIDENIAPDYIGAGYWYVNENIPIVSSLYNWQGNPPDIPLYTSSGAWFTIKLFSIQRSGRTRSSMIYQSSPDFKNTYMSVMSAFATEMKKRKLDDGPTGYNPFGRFMNDSTDRRCIQPSDSNIENAITAVLDNDYNNKKEIKSEYEIEGMIDLTSYPLLSGKYYGYDVYAAKNGMMNVEKLDPIETYSDGDIENYHRNNNLDKATTWLSTKVVSKILNVSELLGKDSTRGITQGQVMGIEANALAKNMGLSDQVGYEWLHLIAFSMGGSSQYGAQHAGNLVLGTEGANSLMLIYENQLKRLAMRNNGQDYQVTVTASTVHTPLNGGAPNPQTGLKQYQTWFTREIAYTYEVKDATTKCSVYKETVHFNPFQTTIPSVMENYLYVNYFIKNQFPSKKKAGAMKSKRIVLDENGIRNLSFKNYQPVSPKELCQSVMEEEHISPETPVLRANRAMKNEGEAFVASMDVLGFEEAPVMGATLFNGRNLATISLNQDTITFADLFEGIEAIPEFAFQNVKINMDYKDESNPLDDELILTGELKLDQDFLTPLKETLGLGDSVYVEGRMKTSGKDLTKKFKPEFLTLKGVAGILVPICDGVTIKEAAVVLCFHREVNYVKNTVGWTCDIGLEGKIEITSLSEEPLLLDCRAEYRNKQLLLVATTKNVQGLFHVPTLCLNTMSLQVMLGTQNQVEFCSSLSTRSLLFDFGGVIGNTELGMYTKVEHFTMYDLAELYYSLFQQEFYYPEFDITFDEIMVGVAKNACTIGTQSLQAGITLSCTITILGHTCKAFANLQKDGISFTGSIDHVSIGDVTILNPTLHLSLYTEDKPSDFYISGAIKVGDLLLEAKIQYEKHPNGWNCLLYAGIEAKSFGLSDLIKPVKDTFVDTLRFSRIAVVYSTYDSRTKDPEFDFEVRRGFQLLGVLEEIPVLSMLTGDTQIGLHFTALYGDTKQLGIAIPQMSIDLGATVHCNPFRVDIVLAPTPSFNLVFGMDVSIPNQELPLHFDLVLGIGVAEAMGSATMKNYWENPFGLQGVKIGPELALQIGIIYATFAETGLPAEFGFAGGMMLGDIEAKMAFNISENPMHELLMGSLKHLEMQDLVKFAASIANLQIPEADIPNFVEINDLSLYVAPYGGKIGTITYQPGVSFAADLVLFGKKAAIYTQIGKTGVVAKGELDAIEVGPLHITGQQGKNAMLDLNLTNTKQSLFVDGRIQLFQMYLGVYADLSNKGIAFNIQSAFLGLSYDIMGKSEGNIQNPETLDFFLRAEFNNTLLDYLQTTVSAKIEQAIADVERSMDEAIAKVEETKKEYEALYIPAKKTLDDAQVSLESYSNQVQKEYQQTKEDFQRKMESARQEVVRAKGVYDSALIQAQRAVEDAEKEYNSAMNDAIKAVQDAQNTYNQAMESAQRDLKEAQDTYDSKMNGAIEAVQDARDKVDSLQREIDEKVNELKHLKWYEYLYKAEYLSAYIASLEAAKLVADGVLYAAEGVLQALKYGVEYTALKAAEGALIAVKEGVYYTTLKAAEGVLEAVKFGGQYCCVRISKTNIRTCPKGK